MLRSEKRLQRLVIAALILTGFSGWLIDAAQTQTRRPAKVSAKTAAKAPLVAKDLTAKDFFEDVAGITEEGLKALIKDRLSYWSRELGSYERWKKRWIEDEKFPRQKAIFAGKHEFATVAELDKQIETDEDFLKKKAQEEAEQASSKASFNIIIHDNKQPELSDIRVLQADSNNKGAFFQVASTKHVLEGSSWHPDVLLSSMLSTPVQGEWAAISAAGATIYRKYFMPIENDLKQRWSEFFHWSSSYNPALYNLFHEIQNKVPSVGNQNYKYDANDKNLMGIFTHSDIYVTNLVQADRTMESIPLEKEQKITQIFNAAHDLRDYLFSDDGLPSEQVIQFAKMVLAGMYEGTIKSAYYQSVNSIHKDPNLFPGRKKLYLTLLGGGSFRNDIGWIADVFEADAFINFIKKSGLEINLIYYPDKARDKAVRTYEGDIDFLNRMAKIADKINDTTVVSQAVNDADARIKSAYENMEYKGVACGIGTPMYIEAEERRLKLSAGRVAKLLQAQQETRQAEAPAVEKDVAQEFVGNVLGAATEEVVRQEAKKEREKVRQGALNKAADELAVTLAEQIRLQAKYKDMTRFNEAAIGDVTWWIKDLRAGVGPNGQLLNTEEEIEQAKKSLNVIFGNIEKIKEREKNENEKEAQLRRDAEERLRRAKKDRLRAKEMAVQTIAGLTLTL